MILRFQRAHPECRVVGERWARFQVFVCVRGVFIVCLLLSFYVFHFCKDTI